MHNSHTGKNNLSKASLKQDTCYVAYIFRLHAPPAWVEHKFRDAPAVYVTSSEHLRFRCTVLERIQYVESCPSSSLDGWRQLSMLTHSRYGFLAMHTWVQPWQSKLDTLAAYFGCIQHPDPSHDKSLHTRRCCVLLEVVLT